MRLPLIVSELGVAATKLGTAGQYETGLTLATSSVTSLAKFLPTKDSDVTGLCWRCVKNRPRGRELDSPGLALALRSSLELTQLQWDRRHISDLEATDFVKVEVGKYCKPVTEPNLLPTSVRNADPIKLLVSSIGRQVGGKAAPVPDCGCAESAEQQELATRAKAKQVAAAHTAVVKASRSVGLATAALAKAPGDAKVKKRLANAEKRKRNADAHFVKVQAADPDRRFDFGAVGLLLLLISQLSEATGSIAVAVARDRLAEALRCVSRKLDSGWRDVQEAQYGSTGVDYHTDGNVGAVRVFLEVYDELVMLAERHGWTVDAISLLEPFNKPTALLLGRAREVVSDFRGVVDSNLATDEKQKQLKVRDPSRVAGVGAKR